MENKNFESFITPGSHFEIPNMKSTSICEMGKDLIAIDDVKNRAGLYYKDNLKRFKFLMSYHE